MTRPRIRVVLATRTLLSFTPVWRAAALAIGELGCVAFFASGVAEDAIGPAAPWYVLAAVVAGACVRAVDVEARGLFVRGGLYGLVRRACGEALARSAASALLVERVLLGSLAAAVAGRYVVALLRTGRPTCPGPPRRTPPSRRRWRCSPSPGSACAAAARSRRSRRRAR